MLHKEIAYIRYDKRNYDLELSKLLCIFKKFFLKVTFEKIENGVIINIPKYKYNKFFDKYIIKQIKKYFQKNNNIKYIAYENNLIYIVEKLKFIILSNNIQILSGKYFMKSAIYEVTDYIIKRKNKNIKLENIYIFVNEFNTLNKEIINQFLLKCKTVNIITENLKKYKKLEEELYKEGILITVSNNKRKSAKMAEFIINVDFPKQSFEKYNINMFSCIINLTNEKYFFERIFNGIIVNNVEINIDNDFENYISEFYGNIDKKMYMDGLILQGKNRNIEKICNENHLEITGIIGIRGLI